jgi:hypothetical protein
MYGESVWSFASAICAVYIVASVPSGLDSAHMFASLADASAENQSAVDCLRRALKNLRELLNTVNDKYTSSVKWVWSPPLLPPSFSRPSPVLLPSFSPSQYTITNPTGGVHSIPDVCRGRVPAEAALTRRRNDTYIREDDVDVKAVVAETLRQRGFGAAEDEAMDVS